MKNAAIILSRYDSNRLPGKALLNIGPHSLLEWCIIRLKRSDKYNIILATSDRSEDDPIEEIALSNEIQVFRGNFQNINQRIKDCIHHFSIENFARVNGDSPFVFSNLLELGFEKVDAFEFVTNLHPRKFPYGVSVEIFRSSSFVNTFETNSEQFHKENITRYFYDHIEDFKIFNIDYNGNDHNIRMTVDTPEDLDLIRGLYKWEPGIFDLSLEKTIEKIKQFKLDD